MEPVFMIFQVLIALGIYNVWILRFQKATAWRGGSAANMREEFTHYGLPVWFMGTIGVLKLLLATLLVLGIFIPAVTKPAALGMAALMTGALAMHFKVNDPLKKSLPAFTLLVLSLIVAIA